MGGRRFPQVVGVNLHGDFQYLGPEPLLRLINPTLEMGGQVTIAGQPNNPIMRKIASASDETLAGVGFERVTPRTPVRGGLRLVEDASATIRSMLGWSTEGNNNFFMGIGVTRLVEGHTEGGREKHARPGE